MEGKPRIVILEDNEIFAALLSATLDADFDIATGSNGLDGLRLCREAIPALVITDIGMPEMDGIQMLAEFQKYPSLASVPVVVITATHFTHRNRNEIARFPQVCRMLCKDDSVDSITAEVRKILGPGPRPAKP